MTDSTHTLRAQLLQLRASHRAGTLDAATYEALKAPLERRWVDAALDEQAAVAPTVPTATSTGTPAPPLPGNKPSNAVWGGAVAFAVLIALAGYAWMGSPGAIGQPPAGFTQGGQRAAAAPASGAAANVTREQMESMVSRLSERLQAQPDDADGWVMLGRSYMALEQPADATKAYQRAIKLRPDDASLLADAADAIAAGSPDGLAGEPMKMIERALQLEPGNLKALALSGSAAFNRGDFVAAAQQWDRVVALGPADSKLVELAKGGADEARQRAAAPAAASSATAVTNANAMPDRPARISGTVRLSPALMAQAAPGDTVFIYARAAEGPRMPLAIVRKQVGDLPFDFVLDDSSAMSPATRLSGATRVVVSARISKSGQAVPQSGDLQAVSPPVEVGARGLSLVIDQRVP